MKIRLPYIIIFLPRWDKKSMGFPVGIYTKYFNAISWWRHPMNGSTGYYEKLYIRTGSHMIAFYKRNRGYTELKNKIIYLPKKDKSDDFKVGICTKYFGVYAWWIQPWKDTGITYWHPVGGYYDNFTIYLFSYGINMSKNYIV